MCKQHHTPVWASISMSMSIYILYIYLIYLILREAYELASVTFEQRLNFINSKAMLYRVYSLCLYICLCLDAYRLYATSQWTLANCKKALQGFKLWLWLYGHKFYGHRLYRHKLYGHKLYGHKFYGAYAPHPQRALASLNGLPDSSPARIFRAHFARNVFWHGCTRWRRRFCNGWLYWIIPYQILLSGGDDSLLWNLLRELLGYWTALWWKHVRRL